MITELTIRNFKGIKEQTYNFSSFDLLVGMNNSGKSTILQALAIWQYCIDAFRVSKTGKGIQIVLPSFTALPIPEFNLLWIDKTDRQYTTDDPTGKSKKKQEYIYIEIDVTWQHGDHSTDSFGVRLRYGSPQSIYASPINGWDQFHRIENSESNSFPSIAYVPPFSGLEPIEQGYHWGTIKEHIGKGQPGSVLRNLLLNVKYDTLQSVTEAGLYPEKSESDWGKVTEVVKKWFNVDLRTPQYKPNQDSKITVEYARKDKDKAFDIISGGSGFHQVLTLLAFLYGLKPTTILLDEPDAHLHTSLQRAVLEYFQIQGRVRGTQFIIATHSEELIRAVASTQIVSLLSQVPLRGTNQEYLIGAMAKITNKEIVDLRNAAVILYVEGESDERQIRSWAHILGKDGLIERVHFHPLQGGSKKGMIDAAKDHFSNISQIFPSLKRLILIDRDDESSFHPEKENPVLVEWGRRNIENYLLVQSAWERVIDAHKVKKQREMIPDSRESAANIIDRFFTEQNLTQPQGTVWRTLNANVFRIIDGKSILFEAPDSLFHQLTRHIPTSQISREAVAGRMTADEIHQDIYHFFDAIEQTLNGTDN